MKNLTSFVDKTYCINLDSRKDRWQDASLQFAKYGIEDQVSRVSAIVDNDPRIGCLKSHLNCVLEAIDRKYENILIFEDDVSFIDFDQKTMKDVIKHLHRDNKWDLFYLGGMVMYPARFVHEHLFKSRFFSTHAYVINRRAYEKVLQATPPIDKWYALNTVAYGLHPMCATQAETYSDIRKKVIVNREETFTKRYQLLVEPNIVKRWINYIKKHYLVNIRPFS